MFCIHLFKHCCFSDVVQALLPGTWKRRPRCCEDCRKRIPYISELQTILKNTDFNYFSIPDTTKGSSNRYERQRCKYCLKLKSYVAKLEAGARAMEERDKCIRNQEKIDRFHTTKVLHTCHAALKNRGLFMC